MKKCNKCNELKSLNDFYKDLRFPNKTRSKCKVCYNIQTKSWKIVNPEKRKIIQNRGHRKYNKNNRAKRTALEAKRRSCKLQQTPKWADLKAIEQFYLNCPKGFHVDHIIPLQGKDVRGLHVLENLQYLPAKDNISKGNKLTKA